MKKFYSMRKILFSGILLFIFSLGWSQALLVEDFNYTAGEELINNNWLLQQTNVTNPILVADGGLLFSGYAGTGIGNAAIIGPTGQDLFMGFTKTSDGSLYMALMVNVTAASETPEYFISFKESSTSATNTNYRGRIFVKRDASDNLAFGVSKGSGSDTYTDFTYSLNTTYLVVLKYTMGPNADDDVAELFIDPVPGEAEPVSLLSVTDSNSEMGMGSVLLRQGSGGPTVTVDGIRVATTWEDAVDKLIPEESLFISEVADPVDFNGRFIELYNASAEAVDFSTVTMYLSRQSNGGGTWGDVQLTGTVPAGETFVLGGTAFAGLYGFAPDQETGIISGNGDDAYYLFSGGDHTTGILHDIYGEPDLDGSGTAWEYTDSRAVRVGGITAPNTTWTASEWEITAADVADCEPGTHDPSVVIDTDPPVFAEGYPKIDNVEDVRFDILVKVDEPGIGYGVILPHGADAPTVEEVIAGTGSGGAAPVSGGSIEIGTSEVSVTVEDEGIVVGTTYDVYLVGVDDEAVPNVQATVTMLEVTTNPILLTADFETDLSPFTPVTVTGAQAWTRATNSGNSYAYANGYSGGAQDNDQYLISGAIDLDASTSNKFSFMTAKNFSGPPLQVLISSDFSGTYDATGIAAATWDDVTSGFAFSGGGYAWKKSGDFDLSATKAYTGTIYIAFRYLSSTTAGAAAWEVDEFKIKGFPIPGSDATLSGISVNDEAIAGFEPSTLTYTYELDAGTVDVPTVTYTRTDENATVDLVPATDLSGDAAARTTTLTVTAQDGETILVYKVIFNPMLEVATIGDLRASLDVTRKYRITGEVLLSFQQAYRNKKYVQDGTAGMEIDDNPGNITTVYAVGDGITGLEGSVEVYNGLLQFHPLADPGAATSTGNTITPIVATPAQIKADIDAYEGMLVTVEDATITEADGTAVFANGGNYELNGVTESMVLRVHFYGTTLTGTVIPDSANVTGILIEYNGTAQLAPRSADDVVELIPYVPSNVATLDWIKYDDTEVSGFSPAQLSYTVTLDAGTTDVPVVTVGTTDENADPDITQATDLSGDAAARTATIVVTAEDLTTTKTYTVVFEVEVSSRDDLFGAVNIYPVPATSKLYLSNTSAVESLTIYNITGTALMQLENAGNDRVTLDISSLKEGVYLLKMVNADGTAISRFVKQ